MNYDQIISQRIQNIKPSGIRKFFDILEEMTDAISLGIGEPDFVTPWHIRDAGIYSLERGHTKYTSNAGMLELRREISNYLRRRFDLSYDYAKQILVTVGGSEAIDLALRCLLNPGDEVIVPVPSFVCYGPLTEMAGGVPVYVELKAEDQFRLTPEQLKAAITPKTKVLVLPFPCNPTGGTMDRQDLEAIAQVLEGTDIMVLSDEIYYSLTYDNEQFTSLAALGEEIKARTLLINGVSKSYAMTGWRIGYVAAPAAISKVIGNYLGHCTGSPSSISQAAAAEALSASQETVEKMREAFEERRNYMVERMNQIEGVSCIKPEGAFYVMMNISKIFGKELFGHVIKDADDFGNMFLKYGKVAVVPGTSFGAPEFIRWSYATSMENIKAGLDRLECFLSGKEV